MGAMFRSEEMALCQLFIQPETAYSAVSELGEKGTVQFRDLNGEVNAFQRKFVNEVRRCDEMERKLRFIEAEVKKDNLHIPDFDEMPTAPVPREIIDLEASIEKTENDIRELSHNAVNLKSSFLESIELCHVLEKTQVFFQEQEGANGIDNVTRSLMAEETNAATVIRGRLGFVAGIIQRERVPAFERMLWRISRGNVFLRRVELEKPLEDPATGNEIYKTVFVAFYQGEQLKTRIKKVCAGFHATLYSFSSNLAEKEDMLKEVRIRLEDLKLVLNQTQDHRQRVLFGVTKELQNWIVMVRKMKAIYHTLNLFNMDVTRKCMIGECWVPVSDLQNVQKALTEGSAASGSSIPSFLNVIQTNENPPTFNRTNVFTKGFQNLIDSYGIASYREVNPALYSIITFPFLFAIMFGDAGHGVILLLFGMYMCINEKKLMKKKITSEIWNIFFAGRYIILLMGMFAIYTGLIYNDVFSKSINIFGTSWNKVNRTDFNAEEESGETLDPAFNFTTIPYPFGVDPIWQLASNKIIFLNTYKMKLSIIFGVIHMIFGVCMSVVNHLHFRRPAKIILEFIPQVIFLSFLFFYMVFMIFYKWVTYGPEFDLKHSPYCAPSILILFINMMLFKHTPPPKLCDEYMFSWQLYLQYGLVGIALACIPVLLLGTPIYEICIRKFQAKQAAANKNGDVNQGIELQPETVEQTKPGPSEHDHHEEPMSEIFIHQAIHTIEYILSTISHTASYLRLWALSLAHAQLSEVLWNMVLKNGLQGNNYVGSVILFAVFAAWAIFTVAILVMMEGLSAFLHTLRLHWVEFMSKFYEGLGYPFQPFYFKHILENEDQLIGEEK